MTNKKNFYERAGITNQAEFYAALYASGELLHPDHFHALERFHIRWARTMWIFDNIAEHSTVLDLGSGAGLLSLLKRKNVRLVSVDLSTACAAASLRNGYDLSCAADLRTLPFADQIFDYVVSLDVMGHIQFEDKDVVLAEIRRVLKHDGETMHGIEIMNTARRKDYEQMTDEELEQFIQVDGHVGMESQADTIARFSRFFINVQAQPRFSICQSAEELVKQADEYGVPLCDVDLLDYLRRLSHNERRAFNMAMGYVFQQISDHAIQLPPSEYTFLKASNAPLGPFYNSHVDRSVLLRCDGHESGGLNQTDQASFDGGWYPAENFPPIGRWMGRRAGIRFRARPFSKLCLTMVTHIPDVVSNPLHVFLSLNRTTTRSLTINNNDPQVIELNTTDLSLGENNDYLLEIKADRTWQPRPDNPSNRDDREISIAVWDIHLIR